MKLFSEFSRKAPNTVFVSIILGGLSGICYSLLIPLVLSALNEGDGRLDTVELAPTRVLSLEVANAPFALIFSLVCLTALFTRTLSQVMLTRVAIDVASGLRTHMYDRIAHAPLPALERIGAPRLIAALTTDVPRIVSGASMLPDILINLVMLVGMLSFLLVLNPDVFWFVLGCIAFGVLTYQIPTSIGRRYFVRARCSFDRLQESIHGLINGIKELKLSDKKRSDYFQSVLMSYEHEVRQNTKAGHTAVTVASNYGDVLSFFAIGSITFIFVNYHVVSTQDLIGVIMVLLYITTPVSVLLHSIPEMAVARVSMQSVAELFQTMPEEELAEKQEEPQPWDRVRFDQVSYHYIGSGDDEGFRVGPMDLELRKGEITFIVGGNGSGKSTLCKLLTLHYRATGGMIYFGDHAITDESTGTYRQLISAIYSDYHLFEQILGITDEGLETAVDHYLAALDLDRKVTYCDGKFSTLSLSSGQRRRMALLASIIDNKELYVFDEWAADQDPAFKAVFYNRILPALKARGKAVIAITHDDRYFHLADQLVVLDEGEIVRVDRQNVQEARALTGLCEPAFVTVR